MTKAAYLNVILQLCRWIRPSPPNSIAPDAASKVLHSIRQWPTMRVMGTYTVASKGANDRVHKHHLEVKAVCTHSGRRRSWVLRRLSPALCIAF